MPAGWSGRQTLERLIEARPELRVVIASGSGLMEDVSSLQQAGAGSILRKPYTLSELGHALREAVATKP